MSSRHGKIVRLIWHLIATGSFVVAREPPSLLADYRSVVYGQVLERVQLTCPVQPQSKDSGLFYNWIKDKESISRSWIRFETKGAHLIIDGVELEDSGTYSCIATNGFGSQTADIILVVTDRLAELSSTTERMPDSLETSNDLLIEGLSFTEETLRQPRQVRVTAGSSVDIQCGVAGYPHPDLIWLKDGAMFKRWQQQNQPDETDWTTSRLTLSIRRASPVSSSGNYTCLALGLKEKIQTTFDIKVLASELPDLSQVEPTNVTERRGGKAKFLCWVHSSSEPQVEWLKRLPPNQSTRNELNLHTNTSLIVGRDHYQKLESEELVQKADGSYLKKLLLDPLNEKDAGLYLCLGSNRYGYNIEKTYLNVQPNYETSKDPKSVPMSIMVALPSVLILSVAAGFVCWMREREKQRRQAALAALDTGWSHAFVERQQQQQQEQQQRAIESSGGVETGRHQQQHGTCHSRQTLTSGTGSPHLLNEETDAVDLIIGKKRTGRLAHHHGDVQPNYYFDRHGHHQLDQQQQRNTSFSLII